MVDDVWVDARSDDEIFALSESIHYSLNTENVPDPDIIQMLERASYLSYCSGVQIVIRPDHEMAGNDALACSKKSEIPAKIFLAESVYKQILSGGSRGRFTLAHELGHVVMHPNFDRPRVANISRSKGFIPAKNSAERQADVFGAGLLIPKQRLIGCKSAVELAEKCNVSLTVARIRIDRAAEPVKNKMLIGELARRLVAGEPLIHQPCSAYAKIITPSLHDIEVWNEACVVDGRDPKIYRMSSMGHLIMFDQLRIKTDFGWFVRNGKAMAVKELLER